MNMKRFVKYMLGAAAAVIAAAVLAVAVVTVGFYGGSSGGSEGRASRPDSVRSPYSRMIFAITCFFAIFVRQLHIGNRIVNITNIFPN